MTGTARERLVTRSGLVASMVAKGAFNANEWRFHADKAPDYLIAGAIRENYLECVIAGRHMGKPITFADAYKAIYGKRLTLERTIVSEQSFEIDIPETH